MEEQSLRSAKIIIRQDRFQIQTDLSDSELNDITNFVSAKLDQYLGENSGPDARKRLILMALDITSEYFDIRRKYSQLQELNRRAEKEFQVLNDLLDHGVEKLGES